MENLLDTLRTFADDSTLSSGTGDRDAEGKKRASVRSDSWRRGSVVVDGVIYPRAVAANPRCRGVGT